MKGLFLSLSLAGLALAGLGDRSSVRQQKQRHLAKRDYDPTLLYPAHNISVPIDHFKNDSSYEPHVNGSFNVRYWFDASYYKEGGPVIVLQGGEDGGDDRLPFLQKGLLHELTKATHGIGVVLEHRYYGESFPVDDLSVENLRFLTTDQAMADQAYFARNIKFPGLEHKDLTSRNAAYITYGGSYAGAFVAFMRVLYPDVFWGAISSSGVPQAIVDYWEYYAAIAEYGPTDCVNRQQDLIQIIDNILSKNDTKLTAQLKDLFQSQSIQYNDEFANSVSGGMSLWQSRNWDYAVGSAAFHDYCLLILNDTLVAPDQTQSYQAEAAAIIKASGVKSNTSLTNSLLNLVTYSLENAASDCVGNNNASDNCLGNRDPSEYSAIDLGEWSWRSWAYQYCTQWGFLQTGSGVPADQRPLISRFITLEYTSLVCQYGFNRTALPDVAAINKHGGYNISYPRLALIDGEVDPWRPAGVHAWEYGAKNRTSTVEEPYHLIPGAVHHWDENGVFPNQTNSTFPPAQIKQIHSEEIKFVKEWMVQYHEHRRMLA